MTDATRETLRSIAFDAARAGKSFDETIAGSVDQLGPLCGDGGATALDLIVECEELYEFASKAMLRG